MSTANSVTGFLLFLFAGGALRLYLEKREAPVPTIENRFDVPALATLAHQLARSGMEVALSPGPGRCTSPSRTNNGSSI